MTRGLFTRLFSVLLAVRVINFPSRLDSADKSMLIELNGLEINLQPREKIFLESLTVVICFISFG